MACNTHGFATGLLQRVQQEGRAVMLGWSEKDWTGTKIIEQTWRRYDEISGADLRLCVQTILGQQSSQVGDMILEHIQNVGFLEIFATN